MQRLPSASASLQRGSRIKTRGEGRRLKTAERRDGKEAFLQGSVLVVSFLIAAGRHIRLKVVCTGSQVGSSLQPLHVMDVLQDHTVGCSPPVLGGDGQGSCWHAEGLAAGYGGLQLIERVRRARSNAPGRLLWFSPEHGGREKPRSNIPQGPEGLSQASQLYQLI